MKRTNLVALLLMILFLMTAMFLSGCTNYEGTAEKSAQEQYEAKGLPGEVEGSYHKDKVDPVGDGDPDNHQMMAMVMLDQAGYDSDLSTYDRVDLVELELANGETVMTVVLDEGHTVVFPQNVESSQ